MSNNSSIRSSTVSGCRKGVCRDRVSSLAGFSGPSADGRQHARDKTSSGDDFHCRYRYKFGVGVDFANRCRLRDAASPSLRPNEFEGV